MQTIRKRALVPCTVAEMYSLVNDIQTYPEFVPWCESTSIKASSETMVIATIHAAKGPIHKSFTSKNLLVKNKSIHMELIDGPFKSLVGSWQFNPRIVIDTKEYCEIEFELKFEFANRLFGFTLAALMPSLVEIIMNAFLQRAEAIYGKK
jgi:ribosome-associated toxin RatA of RatAB toxin-antitoxin module